MANRFLSIGRGFSWRCPLWSTSGKMVGFGFPIHGLWPCPISWDFCRIYIYMLYYIYIYILYIYIYNIQYNIYIYIYIYIDDISPTWNLRPFGDDSPSPISIIPGFGRTPAAPSTKRIRVSSNKNLRDGLPWTPVIFWIFGSLKIAGYCGMTLGITLYHTLCQSRSIYITRYHPFGRSWNFGNTPKTCIEHPILGAIPWFRQRMLGDL